MWFNGMGTFLSIEDIAKATVHIQNAIGCIQSAIASAERDYDNEAFVGSLKMKLEALNEAIKM
ncbi:MAG: hypothetical protein RSF40_01670 [Oscillospiraceae bacterium]